MTTPRILGRTMRPMPSATSSTFEALIAAVAAAPPRPSWARAPGERLGPYVVRGALGRGGMGEVYRAFDPRLGRDVAIKVLNGRETSGEALERFVLEAHVLAAIRHPGVVTVFDYGVADGAPYLVLELIEGETLREVLARGPLSPHDALAWLRAMVAAVDAVHAHGVVHRDLKPENVIRARDGVIRILDFGLAKLVDAPRALTAPHQLVGTVDYMAPEQISGGGVTPAADQFALAVLLVEMLSGRRLFRRASVVETLYAITGEPVDVRAALGPQVPAHWPAAIARALDRDPRRRYDSAQALLEALTRHAPLAPPEPEAPPTRYAQNGGVHLAYRVYGRGPVDLVVVPGFVSQVEEWWSEPEGARFMHALGAAARVVVFDKRGVGLSDRGGGGGGFQLDTRVDDVRAVMDAAGVERAVILGISEGGPVAAGFSVRHPLRTRGLALYGTAARFRSQRRLDALRRAIVEGWGRGGTTPLLAPSAVGVPRLEAWLARWERLSASPGTVLSIIDVLEQVDVRPLLPRIAAPTLVLHRRGDPLVGVAGGAELAAAIPDARWVVQEGLDHTPMLGDAARLLAALTSFARECGAQGAAWKNDCSVAAREMSHNTSVPTVTR